LTRIGLGEIFPTRGVPARFAPASFRLADHLWTGGTKTMDARPSRLLLTIILAAMSGAGTAGAQGVGREAFLIRDASVQLEGYMVDRSVQIPPQVLEQAEGIAIFPELIKAGFVIGARHGRGILVVRNPDRTWSQPIFMALTSASIGLQAGVQSTDLVLVFTNRQSVRRFLMGKGTLSLDGNMSIAVGPNGAQLGGATNPRLSAEILAYGRNRGLFAGLAAGGSTISIARKSNLNYYGSLGNDPSTILSAVDMPISPEVAQLLETLDNLSGAVGSAGRQMDPAPGVRVLPAPSERPARIIEGDPAHDFPVESTPAETMRSKPAPVPAPSTDPSPLPLPPDEDPIVNPPRRESRPTEKLPAPAPLPLPPGAPTPPAPKPVPDPAPLPPPAR
jgi:lipid-binding SYLF domain-containing protein